MKHITLEILGPTIFRIVKQTHRGPVFGKIGDTFVASNGFELRSALWPQLLNNACYMRGVSTRLDEEILTAESPHQLKLIQDAVNEYNAYFADKEVIEHKIMSPTIDPNRLTVIVRENNYYILAKNGGGYTLWTVQDTGFITFGASYSELSLLLDKEIKPTDLIYSFSSLRQFAKWLINQEKITAYKVVRVTKNPSIFVSAIRYGTNTELVYELGKEVQLTSEQKTKKYYPFLFETIEAAIVFRHSRCGNSDDFKILLCEIDDVLDSITSIPGTFSDTWPKGSIMARYVKPIKVVE